MRRISRLLLERVPLLPLAVCMILGIVAGDFFSPVVPLLPVFIVTVVVALLLRRHAILQSFAIASSFLVLGVLLAQRSHQSLQVVWPDEEMSYKAVVMSDPVEKPKTMAMDVILIDSQRKLKCYLQKDARSRALHVGDGLLIRSKVRGNSDWHIGRFDYRRFLEIHGFTGNTFVTAWNWQKATFSLKGLSRPVRTKLFFLKLRSRLLQRLAVQGLAEDQYAVVAAMVLGDKAPLSRDLKDVYSQTGASHVLALSGLHLSIIYILLSLLMAGRRRRTVTQVCLVLAIWAYVFLVGLSTSVIRSAVMLTVYALLSLGHRDKMSVNALAFTAIAMLLLNPLTLFDVGFQLSFSSVLSILMFVPLLDALVPDTPFRSRRLMKWLWGMVAVSFAAQLGVAPLVAYYFGRFPTYFLLTNIVVIPVVTLVLYLAPVVLIVPSLTGVLSSLVGVLNAVLTRIASIPGASIGGLHPTALQVAMLYVLIVALYILWVKLTWPKTIRR